MTERCADCPCELTCTEFARCVLEPIPEDYGVEQSTGAVLGKILLADETLIPLYPLTKSAA